MTLFEISMLILVILILLSGFVMIVLEELESRGKISL